MDEFRTAKEVKALPDYKLWIKFDNEDEGTVDLSHLIDKGVFSIWSNLDNFNNFDITDSSSVISWSNSIDISVDCLYENWILASEKGLHPNKIEPLE